MGGLSNLPARVGRARAMALLCIADPRVFNKVVDATPGLAHRLPGERRSKYVTAVLVRLLDSPTVCDPRGGTSNT